MFLIHTDVSAHAEALSILSLSAGLGPKRYTQLGGKRLDGVLLSTLLHAQHKHSFLTSVTYPHQYFSREKKKKKRQSLPSLAVLPKTKLRKSNVTLWPLHLATPQCYFLLVSIQHRKKLVLGSGP